MSILTTLNWRKSVLRQAQKLGTSPLSIALVADTAKVRDILSGGAHFVLYKPISEDAAKAGLRAAAALLGRERRRAVRIPVQAPVEITLPDTRKMDGILLDLSETGMEVLTAEAQVPGALLAFHFQLPDGDAGNRGPRAGGVGESQWADRRSLSGCFRSRQSRTEGVAAGRGRGSGRGGPMKPYRIAS